MSRLPGENLKKNHFIFLELLPFANLNIENLISQTPAQMNTALDLRDV